MENLTPWECSQLREFLKHNQTRIENKLNTAVGKIYTNTIFKILFDDLERIEENSDERLNAYFNGGR